MHNLTTPDVDRSRANAVDHGITIEAQPWHPSGTLYLAMCLCGFTAPIADDRRRAVDVGRWHVEAPDAHPNWCTGPNHSGAFVFGEHDHISAPTGFAEAEVFEPGPDKDATTTTVYATDYTGMPAGVEMHVFNESQGRYVDTTFILKPDAADELIAALSAANVQVRAWESVATR